MILLATLIWGTGWSINSAAMDILGPFSYNAGRFFVGGCAALCISLIMRKHGKAGEITRGQRIGTLKAGLILGGILFVSVTFQQFGLVFTTVAKAGFITSLYVVAVPLASLFFGRKARIWVWLGVALAIIGMYFMSLSGVTEVNPGDMLVLVCAISYAAQILAVDHFSPKFNPVPLAYTQFFLTSALSLMMALIFERPAIAAYISAAGHILFTGMLGSGAAYILQMLGQRTTDPTIASIMFSQEAVIAAFVGWLWLGEILTPRELLGCGLVFAAVLVSQIKFERKEGI